MPTIREASDVEAGKAGAAEQTEDFPPNQEPPKRKCNYCRYVSIILAVAVAAVLLGTIIPMGLRDRRQQPANGTPNYKFTGDRLNTTIPFVPASANETLARPGSRNATLTKPAPGNATKPAPGNETVAKNETVTKPSSDKASAPAAAAATGAATPAAPGAAAAPVPKK